MTRIRQFFRPMSPLSGEMYALIGFTIFGIKFYCDHFFAKWVFGRPWQVCDYFRGRNVAESGRP